MADILGIVVLVIFGLFVIDGWRKGLFRKITGVLSFVLACILVPFALPYVTDYVKEQTPVYDVIVQQCEKTLTEEIMKEMPAGTEAGAMTSLSQIEQTKLIRSLPLPEFMQNSLLSNNNRDGYRALEATGFTGYLVRYVANVILNILTFILTLMLVYVVVWIILKIAGIASRLPFINLLDRLGGLVLGGVQGLIAVWFLLLIVSMLSGTQIGLTVNELLSESTLIRPIYQNNVLMKLISDTVNGMM
ncbi:MAG: CvpA family protein [Lachnospiraceae bacterium]|nr:CvpA family protein [Lachnospiraceae bacterium]